MATTVTKIVDPDNGTGTDYTSIAAWESAQAGDLVTADEIREAKCRCTGGTADGGLTIGSGWTTDSTRYARVYTDTGESYRHNGTYPSSGNIYRMESSGTRIVDAAQDIDLRIEGIALKMTSSASWRYGIWYEPTAAELHLYDNIWVSGGGNSSYGVRIRGTNGTIYIRNNLIYDWSAYGILRESYNLNLYAYNNTVCDCGVGFEGNSTGATKKLRNNVAQGNTTDYSSSSHWTTADSNLSEDTTAPGTNAKTSTTVVFEAEGSDDFRLGSGDEGNALNTGANLSGDSDMAFSVDCVNTSRPQGSAWDRGFHERVAAGATGRLTATQANLTYDAKTGRLTATQADLTFNLKEARVTATQAELTFDAKTARLTATQGDLVFDPKEARLTATQADLVFDVKEARLTATQADLTFDLKEARVTATQADLVFDPKTARLTATQGDLVFDPKEARITATQADLVFDLKEARITATQADLEYDLDLTARITATQADLTFDPKAARLTATQGDLVYDAKEARLTATQADLVFDPKTARLTATQADLVFDPKTVRLTATQADVVYDPKTARLTATQADIEYTVSGVAEARITATQADLVYEEVRSALPPRAPMPYPLIGRRKVGLV